MAIGALILGPTGTGKSASMEALNPSNTVIINVAEKPLPYRMPEGFHRHDITIAPSAGSIINTSDYSSIISTIEFISSSLPDVTRIVIDDFGYIAVKEYMERIKEKSFDKFSDIGNMYWQFGKIQTRLRQDLILFIMAHNEVELDAYGNKSSKFKTIGKLTDKMIVFEGLFSIVLESKMVKTVGQPPSYVFVTQTDGATSSKSPKGMFDLEIPNDLEQVSNIITEFYS